jgi:hypothetical protein
LISFVENTESRESFLWLSEVFSLTNYTLSLMFYIVAALNMNFYICFIINTLRHQK